MAAVRRRMKGHDPPGSGGPTADFQRAFSRRAILGMAGSRAFERGRNYAANGRVRKLLLHATAAEATVRGSALYRVRLWVEDADAGFTCSCPVGEDGEFCKHCVAVALVALERGAPDDGSRDVRTAPDVRAYLDALDHARLVDLVLELSDDDELLRARLQLDAARAVTRPVSLQPLKDAIDAVFVTGEFVCWRESHTYATNIESTLDTLRTLLRDGHAEAVVELAEHALARLEDAVGSVDDSDGHLGGIAGDLEALHLRACEAACPDPEALAARLFEWERDAGDLDVFSGAAFTYAHLLGDKGLAKYRCLAEAEWELLPPLRPGDEGSFIGKRFRITHMMEALAEATGDVDAAVAVLARDQSSAWQFVRIAERLRQAGRLADALAWAERGLASFGAQTDPRLVELLADEYHRAGRGADAVALLWRVFDDRPSPTAYRRLAAQATRAGVWTTWRQRALIRLRTDVDRRMKADRSTAGPRTNALARWRSGGDASDVVDVFLWEGEVEEAWAEAQTWGCSDRLWIDLARRRESEHPSDAIPIWQAEVERAIDVKRNDTYRRAVEVMAHVANLMHVAGQPEAFPPYAAGVRARHKAKRNLVKLLDDRRW